MSDCSICCESFNKSNRCKINCKTCESEDIKVCKTCAKKYILDQPTDPSCMVCKVEWDIEFMNDNFTKTFITKELKIHRENYLLEKQIALLPDTQDYAEQLKLINGFEKQKDILIKEKKELEMKLKKINSNIRILDTTIADIRLDKLDINKSKNELTIKCPVENCNGFLNNKYYCGICENNICKHCMEIKDEEHVCDEEKKETVSFLKKDAKPCPKCGQFIHKIDGCDQMYCISCHTAFSWRTGLIERGNVHNPEYYRWMRENGRDIPREPLDIVNRCDNNYLINYNELIRILRIYYPVSRQTNRYGTFILVDDINVIKIANMHRVINHINFINQDERREEIINERILRDMRAAYLLNDLTKETFKKKLQMLDKKTNKNKKLNNIWNLVRLVLIEYIGQITEINNTNNNNNNNDEIKEIINNIIYESEEIKKYANNLFYKIGKMFNMTYPGINDEWIHIGNWDVYIKSLKKK